MSESVGIQIIRNQELDPYKLIERLLDQGYQRVNKVIDPGDVALRGGVLDLYPEGFEAPVRMEFDHETVEAIRSVHPLTGKSFQEHEIVMVLPTVRLHRKTLKSKSNPLFMGEYAPLDPFVDINQGDYVVHVEHGIGKYVGLQKIQTADGVKDHVVLSYLDDDKVYVPLDQMHLMQRYIGFEGAPPKLSKLGAKHWTKAKASAQKNAESVAKDLLLLQAQRLSVKGHAFASDNEWMQQLVEDFPYEETAGQQRALQEIWRDMEAQKPMDRLLCGDVGYGKTEVALRAAFKAVSDNKQVVLLCPTTILAEQHYTTFKKRFKAFPVEVAMLSRFQTAKEQKQIVEALKLGHIDVVIGTHRLFSGDVALKRLGLVIVDEEQRFGVRHKERLKKLRAQVDVLTLTATPIPRTLYLALMQAKSMSVIDTPPVKRKAVQTHVSEEDDAMIQMAIQRELDRKGQVFVVYPWIEGLFKLHRKITRLLPDAVCDIAHGQLPAKALEGAVLRFMRGETQVLISTAIVESGIDIPNANTILVFRADSFGLADLYQLRGRVGRFIRQAHAYFFTPKNRPLTQDAQKRLNAVEEFSDLGAGFQMALKDLQLRGAGNLLGTQQHGHISAIGFDLYCRLLKGEITRLKTGPSEG